jgi:hypothetical protein
VAKQKIIQEDGTDSSQQWVQHTQNNRENNNRHNRSDDECKCMWAKKFTTSVTNMAKFTYFNNHIITLTKIFKNTSLRITYKVNNTLMQSFTIHNRKQDQHHSSRVYLLNFITHITISTQDKLADNSLTDLRSCNRYQKQQRKS